MTTFAFANNVNTELASSISSSDTTITLSSGANLPTIPAGYFMAITLNDAATQQIFEIVYATAISGTTLTVVRAQEGTTAHAWAAGDYVFSGPTAGQMEELQDGIGAGVSSWNTRTGAVNPQTGDYTWSQIGGSFPFVQSFNGRVGSVVLSGTDVATALGYTPANDADVVHLAGTETITGSKLFTADTGFQAPSDDYANLAYFGPGDPNKRFYIATNLGNLTWISPGWYGTARYQWITGGGGNMTLDYNCNLSTTGTVTGSNLSGVNTGDQNLAPYALLSGDTFTGPVTVGSSFAVQSVAGKHILVNNDGVNNAIISEPVGGGSYLPLYLYVSSLNVMGALGATTGSFSGDVGCEALNCTTMNASSSDRRLKRDIKKFEPRPLHRAVPFVSYTLKENGWRGLGSVAQNMQKIAPEHVGEFDWHGKRRLNLNYAGAAYEQAVWAGRELDRQAKLIASLEKRLAKLETCK